MMATTTLRMVATLLLVTGVGWLTGALPGPHTETPRVQSTNQELSLTAAQSNSALGAGIVPTGVSSDAVLDFGAGTDDASSAIDVPVVAAPIANEATDDADALTGLVDEESPDESGSDDGEIWTSLPETDSPLE